MRCVGVALLVAVAVHANPPDRSPDVVLVFTSAPKYTRSQWLEVLREYAGVAKDDKKKIRELSRQPFGPRRGTIGTKYRKFAYEVVDRGRLKDLYGGRQPDPEVKGGLRLWHVPWKMPGRLTSLTAQERDRFSGYLMVLKVAARFVTDDTREVWFPNRGVSYRRPSGVTTEALRGKLRSKKPLLALGLVKKPAKDEATRLAEAIAAANEQARREWSGFIEAWRSERRRGQFDLTVYHGFRVAVRKPGGLPNDMIWLEPDACGDWGLRAKGREYKLDEIADWMYFDSVLKRAHGRFVTDAVLDISHRILTERD